ncbi:Hypothetical protein PACV_95 [Pacmanvirus A23]|uniref:Hypothetical protein n=1 Tax=Pacmanvirus A23 TaxID=1932881 RepID=UPI000A095AC6|nr:Hypothetical protein B9W72_gp095 [Pacmanvirus A23]SIP85812.1 Hypothetical protein PACV_95 [Pacmanvirus A23]
MEYLMPELVVEILKFAITMQTIGAIYPLACSCKLAAEYVRENASEIATAISRDHAMARQCRWNYKGRAKILSNQTTTHRVLPNGVKHGKLEMVTTPVKPGNFEDILIENWSLGLRHGACTLVHDRGDTYRIIITRWQNGVKHGIRITDYLDCSDDFYFSRKIIQFQNGEQVGGKFSFVWRRSVVMKSAEYFDPKSNKEVALNLDKFPRERDSDAWQEVYNKIESRKFD